MSLLLFVYWKIIKIGSFEIIHQFENKLYYRIGIVLHSWFFHKCIYRIFQIRTYDITVKYLYYWSMLVDIICSMWTKSQEYCRICNFSREESTTVLWCDGQKMDQSSSSLDGVIGRVLVYKHLSVRNWLALSDYSIHSYKVADWTTNSKSSLGYWLGSWTMVSAVLIGASHQWLHSEPRTCYLGSVYQYWSN